VQTYIIEPGGWVARRSDVDGVSRARSEQDRMGREIGSLRSLCLSILTPSKHLVDSTGLSDYVRLRLFTLEYRGRYNVFLNADHMFEGGQVVSLICRFNSELTLAKRFIQFIEKEFGHRISDVVSLELEGTYAILPRVRVGGSGQDRTIKSLSSGKCIQVFLSDSPIQKLMLHVYLPLYMPRRFYQHRDWYLRTELVRKSPDIQSLMLVADIRLENEAEDNLLHVVPFSNLMFLYKNCRVQLVDVVVLFFPTESDEAISYLKLSGDPVLTKSLLLSPVLPNVMHWRIRDSDLVRDSLMVDCTPAPALWMLELGAHSSTTFQYRMNVEIRVEVVYLLY